jgi:Asp-tRNA(Asn)/Glu-tRNA(Gln) amidotransferase C subunit
MTEPLITEHTVKELARLAGLDLEAERIASLTPGLNHLLTEADAVNRFMAPRRDVGPGTRFAHPQIQDEG